MDKIPCTNAKANWGGLTDIRHQWELSLWTGSNCTNSRKPGLLNHTIAAKYFNASYGRVNSDEAMRIFFLIRRMRYCHSVLPASSCYYPLADINQLAALVVKREFTYWSSWAWQNQGLTYDLGTQDPMRFWCLYMDIFWNDVNATIRSTIEARFSIEIDTFNSEFDTRHVSEYHSKADNFSVGFIQWQQLDSILGTSSCVLGHYLLLRRCQSSNGDSQSNGHHVPPHQDVQR